MALVERRDKVGVRGNFRAVEADDDIALLQARLFRAAARFHALDHRAARKAVGRSCRAVKVLDRHAEICSAGHMAVLLQIVNHAQRVVDRNGKADALDARAGGGGAGIFRARDADDVAVHVKQRAAGVAGVDSHIRLEHVDGLAVSVDLAVKRAHNTSCHRKRQLTKRIADGDDLFADLNLVRVADGHSLKAGCVDFQKRHIVHFVRTDDFCVVFVAVIELDGDARRAFDNVVICHDVAVARQDEAAAAGGGRCDLTPDVGGDLRRNADRGVYVHRVNLFRCQALAGVIARKALRERRLFKAVAAVFRRGVLRVILRGLDGLRTHRFLRLGVCLFVFAADVIDDGGQRRAADRSYQRNRNKKRDHAPADAVLLFGVLVFVLIVVRVVGCLMVSLRAARLVRGLKRIAHSFVFMFHHNDLLLYPKSHWFDLCGLFIFCMLLSYFGIMTRL